MACSPLQTAQKEEARKEEQQEEEEEGEKGKEGGWKEAEQETEAEGGERRGWGREQAGRRWKECKPLTLWGAWLWNLLLPMKWPQA